ncbi:hypothetical protein CHARACLAT_027371 [Characodon lateralis]|uniref:Uncharacterized protein n=1 Tax=Characodon lateralis TaxID=208331 RepID=A0ABU7DDH4_9TELE|nr:hypothetical protein [Characodon lateralis]
MLVQKPNSVSDGFSSCVLETDNTTPDLWTNQTVDNQQESSIQLPSARFRLQDSTRYDQTSWTKRVEYKELSSPDLQDYCNGVFSEGQPPPQWADDTETVGVLQIWRLTDTSSCSALCSPNSPELICKCLKRQGKQPSFHFTTH